MDVNEAVVGPHKRIHEHKKDDAREDGAADKFVRLAVVFPKVLISYEKPEEH